MKRDRAEQIEQELLQPLAEALRAQLGDVGEVHVRNEPRLMSSERVEYTT
ncbi:hypothetical protein TM48_02759 [Mycobacterium shottsii]|uniref:Uncharacterized protein n=1 Tax=Mycobacterium shottsii TaxID=133549 RepID=A0A7I7LED4_9MYCO|nr:hypothetical protein [Mycobacterium shottsii]QYL28433.1 hypothetical protein TM48_02759 [Mycobacterium shottsii]BBX58396.1 hypothetical protein MSHO_37410 [Mycobacterium shottsii]